MEMTTSATSQPPASHRTMALAVSILRRCGGAVRETLRGAGAALADPMTCNAYWIASSPMFLGSKK